MIPLDNSKYRGVGTISDVDLLKSFKLKSFKETDDELYIELSTGSRKIEVPYDMFDRLSPSTIVKLEEKFCSISDDTITDHATNNESKMLETDRIELDRRRFLQLLGIPNDVYTMVDYDYGLDKLTVAGGDMARTFKTAAEAWRFVLDVCEKHGYQNIDSTELVLRRSLFEIVTCFCGGKYFVEEFFHKKHSATRMKKTLKEVIAFLEDNAKIFVESESWKVKCSDKRYDVMVGWSTPIHLPHYPQVFIVDGVYKGIPDVPRSLSFSSTAKSKIGNVIKPDTIRFIDCLNNDYDCFGIHDNGWILVNATPEMYKATLKKDITMKPTSEELAIHSWVKDVMRVVAVVWIMVAQCVSFIKNKVNPDGTSVADAVKKRPILALLLPEYKLSFLWTVVSNNISYIYEKENTDNTVETMLLTYLDNLFQPNYERMEKKEKLKKLEDFRVDRVPRDEFPIILNSEFFLRWDKKSTTTSTSIEEAREHCSTRANAYHSITDLDTLMDAAFFLRFTDGVCRKVIEKETLVNYFQTGDMTYQETILPPIPCDSNLKIYPANTYINSAYNEDTEINALIVKSQKHKDIIVKEELSHGVGSAAVVLTCKLSSSRIEAPITSANNIPGKYTNTIYSKEWDPTQPIYIPQSYDGDKRTRIKLITADKLATLGIVPRTFDFNHHVTTLDASHHWGPTRPTNEFEDNIDRSTWGKTYKEVDINDTQRDEVVWTVQYSNSVKQLSNSNFIFVNSIKNRIRESELRSVLDDSRKFIPRASGTATNRNKAKLGNEAFFHPIIDEITMAKRAYVLNPPGKSNISEISLLKSGKFNIVMKAGKSKPKTIVKLTTGVWYIYQEEQKIKKKSTDPLVSLNTSKTKQIALNCWYSARWSDIYGSPIKDDTVIAASLIMENLTYMTDLTVGEVVDTEKQKMGGASVCPEKDIVFNKGRTFVDSSSSSMTFLLKSSSVETRDPVATYTEIQEMAYRFFVTVE